MRAAKSPRRLRRLLMRHETAEGMYSRYISGMRMALRTTTAPGEGRAPFSPSTRSLKILLPGVVPVSSKSVK